MSRAREFRVSHRGGSEGQLSEDAAFRSLPHALAFIAWLHGQGHTCTFVLTHDRGDFKARHFKPEGEVTL